MKEKKKIIQSFCWGVALILSSVTATAQSPVVVNAQMDSTAIMMGEQTTIRLEVSHDKETIVNRPVLQKQDTLVTGVEILKVSAPDTVDLKNNRIQVSRTVLITSFEPGLYYLPPFKYVADNDTVETQSLSLKVVAVPLDSTQITMANIDQIEIKDAKSIEEPKFVLWDFIPRWVLWVLLMALIVGVAIFIKLRYFPKKQKRKQGKPEIVIPPYDRAIQALIQLKEEKLWQQGQDKLYYTGLTDILREYIEGRFGVNAMEMTTPEILNALRHNEESRSLLQQLRNVLETADFVKFAKMRPLPDENEQVMRYAETFVNETKPVEKLPEESDKAPVKKDKSKGRKPLK